MDFVLFHAGKPEEKLDKHGNAADVISEKTEKVIVRSTQGLFRFIPRKVKVQVWSENIPHISRTAEILAEELGVKRKFTKCIGKDDVNELLKTIQGHAKDDCVVVVCERPQISYWCEQLVHYPLPFNECSTAGFRVHEDGAGELLWFVQQVELGRIR